jgi:CRISPR-associated exonuclease Cas4
MVKSSRKKGQKKGQVKTTLPASKDKVGGNSKKSSEPELSIMSASDIERFGYCPLSWWLKYKGVTVSDEILEKGTEDHRKLIKKISKVKERQKSSQSSEFNIKLFAFVATVLAVNAIAILIPNPMFKAILVHFGL